MTANEQQPTRPYIGGQAVLEGVMMRSPTSFAVVVRRRDGSLHVRERAMVDARTGMAKLPLVRGVASLVESLKLGSEALRFSAEQMERDLDAEEAADAARKAKKTAGTSILSAIRAVGYTLFLLTTADGDPSSGPAKTEEKKGSKTGMTLMLVLMVGILIALPQAAAEGANKWLKLGFGVQTPQFQALTGLFKLTIVVGYLFMVRKVFADIRRVFQYHGAEHKTITTYEANEPLDVAHARTKTTLHPRCGTTFLVMVALVSIIVFTAIGSSLPQLHTGSRVGDSVVFFLVKLPFLPLIAAVTFEIQRFFARYCTRGPLRALLWPGFLCQKITTIEPDDNQLEVALASLRVTLFRERGEDVKAGGDVRYASFDALMKSPHLRRAA
ncbi:MAG TPA: DUF1385 domain-containing protein [Labilithrix sp.]